MKMKLKRFFGGSIVFDWLVTYLVLLFAMLSIVIIMSNYSVKTLENEIKTSNQHFVTAIGNDVDNAIEQAENIYEEIFFSQWFQTINTATQFDPNTRFSIYKLYDELRVKGATSPLVGMSMVYFPEIDTIVSDQASLTSEYFYKIFLSDSGIDYASYRMMLDNRYSNEYLLLPNGKGQGLICYATTYPVSSSFAGRANIVVLISPKKMSGLLDEYINYQISGIGIQSDSGQPMLLNAKSGSNEILLKYLSDYKQDGMYRTDGGSMMISSISSHVKGWRYISLSPANTFWESSNYVKRASILTLFFGFLFCLMGIAFSMVKNYSPVRQLVNLAKSILPSGIRPSNEFTILNNAIEHIRKGKEKSDMVLFEQGQKLTEAYIWRLTTGQLEPDVKARDHPNVSFAGERFVVAALGFAYTGQVFGGAGISSDPAQDERLLRFAFMNILQDTLPFKEQIYSAQVGNTMSLLINLTDSQKEEQILAQVAESLRQTSSILNTFFSIVTYCTIGPVVKGGAAIHEAFDIAARALEYKRLLNMDEMMAQEIISAFPSRGYHYPPNVEYQLGKQIMAGDFYNAEKLLDNLFEINFKQNRLPLNLSKCLIFDIMGTIAKLFSETGNPQDMELLDRINPAERINGNHSLSEIQEEVKEIVRLICGNRKELREKTGKSSNAEILLIFQVKKYIEQNLLVPTLDISSISDYFGVNASSLSNLFREVEEERLIDYIYHLRISRIKVLLAESDKSIDEIAEETGFSGAKTLTRVFKKYESFTPGSWRRLGKN